MPRPFFRLGEVLLNASYSLRLRSQSQSRRPCSTHSRRPQVRTVNLSKGSTKPASLIFCRRKSIGSQPFRRAMSSICDSMAKFSCGIPYPRIAAAEGRLV